MASEAKSACSMAGARAPTSGERQRRIGDRFVRDVGDERRRMRRQHDDPAREPHRSAWLRDDKERSIPYDQPRRE